MTLHPPERPHYHAEEHLRSADPRLARLVESIGPCRIRLDPNPFSVLVRAVIAQQISTKAAESISKRVQLLCGKPGLKPRVLHEIPDDTLQACGLTRGKLKTIRGLATLGVERPRFYGKLARLESDQEVRELLLPLHGIGPWTVEMFLIFGLGRVDVLPVGDLGLRIGVKEVFELEEVPSAERLLELGERWRPYRTIATWYFWRSREGETQWG